MYILILKAQKNNITMLEILIEATLLQLTFKEGNATITINLILLLLLLLLSILLLAVPRVNESKPEN